MKLRATRASIGYFTFFLQPLGFCRLHLPRNMQDSAVGDALAIRAGVRFCSESLTIVGSETLGMACIEDECSVLFGQMPLPSALDFQIDTIAISYMQRRLRAATKRLKQLIFSKDNRRSWYEVFLTSFVLLCTLEWVLQRQREYLNMNTQRVRRVHLLHAFLTTIHLTRLVVGS